MGNIKNLHVCSLGIANRLMDACVERDILDITNMKIQKLCYYTYALFFAREQSLLFDCEDIMFWKFGPVIPRVYDSLKHYQHKPVDAFILDDCPFDDLENPENNECKLADIKEHRAFDRVMGVVNDVLDCLGTKTAHELRDLSHQEGSAWYELTNNGKDNYKRLTEDKLSLIQEESCRVF